MLQFIVSLFILILLYILLIATSARFFVEGREVFLFLFLIYLVPLADLFCTLYKCFFVFFNEMQVSKDIDEIISFVC